VSGRPEQRALHPAQINVTPDDKGAGFGGHLFSVTPNRNKVNIVYRFGIFWPADSLLQPSVSGHGRDSCTPTSTWGTSSR
jgi:hypothetical protein